MPPEVQPSHNNVSIPLAILAAGGLIALAIFFGGSRLGGGSLVGGAVSANNPIKIEPVSQNDRILGDPNASIVVVEYSDLECPFCKVFHNTMHQIVDEYAGQVAWVYRHFPIAELHSKAPKEAEASLCAFDQGGNTIFWKYIDKVFATTGSNNTLDASALPKIAGDLGLDVASFNTCLSSGKYTKQIESDTTKAIDAGARGTPYSLILKDGKQVDFINGAEPIEDVRLKIGSALK